jgi:hypothetical protein
MTADQTPPPPAQVDTDAVLATALRLAARGTPVLPCAPGQKRPLTAHGLYDATTDPDRIRSWWHRHPTANLAVPTGRTFHDVLDVDVRADGSGFPAFHRLQAEGLLDGHTHVVSTPSGGLHAYFPGTSRPSGRLPAHHLDLKAAGGYVLVPPSVVDGRAYELVRETGRRPRPLNWDAVRALLDGPPPTPVTPLERPQRRSDLTTLARWVERLPEGQRNTGTYWAACRAVEQGVHDLSPLVQAAVSAGLPHAEAMRTVSSALRSNRAVSAHRAPKTPQAGRRGGRGRS